MKNEQAAAFQALMQEAVAHAAPSADCKAKLFEEILHSGQPRRAVASSAGSAQTAVHPPVRAKNAPDVTITDCGPDMQDRRERRISQMTNYLGRSMTRRVGKILLAASICLLIISGSVFAAGRIVSIFSSSSSSYESTEYKDIETLQAQAGLEVSTVESFSNGFAFKGVNIVDQEGQDDAGNPVTSWKSLSADYQDQDGRVVSVDMEDSSAIETDLSANALQETVIDGTPAYFDRVEYHMVEPSYQPSEEELARCDNDPHYTISYGAIEETTVFFNNVSFEKDGIRYLLLTEDDVNADELFGMAQEILEK